jgi:alpha-glucosidase
MPGTGQGRDPERTPMPWDGGANAGFTTGSPWLPVGDANALLNVAAQRGESGSMLSLVRALLALRRERPALRLGDWAPIATAGDVLVYLRRGGGQSLLVALNLDPEPKGVVFTEEQPTGILLLSTHLDRTGERIAGELSLRADEGVVIELRAP